MLLLSPATSSACTSSRCAGEGPRRVQGGAEGTAQQDTQADSMQAHAAPVDNATVCMKHVHASCRLCVCCWPGALSTHTNAGPQNAGQALPTRSAARLDAVPVRAPGRKGQAPRPAQVPLLWHCLPRVQEGEEGAPFAVLHSYCVPGYCYWHRACPPSAMTSCRTAAVDAVMRAPSPTASSSAGCTRPVTAPRYSAAVIAHQRLSL